MQVRAAHIISAEGNLFLKVLDKEFLPTGCGSETLPLNLFGKIKYFHQDRINQHLPFN